MTAANPGKLVGALAVLAAAEKQGGVGARVKGVIDREYAGLEKFYKECHKAPELSLCEEQTSKRFAGELRSAGFEVTERVGGWGVVGVMKNGEGKTLLIRTDMDALPIKEETGADYASKVVMKDADGVENPVMHACGHDMHMTCVNGAARTLAALKDSWKGTLMVVGQPAEEVLRGARMMIQDGLLEKFPKPDYCLAQHVNPYIEVGRYGYVTGNAFANLDNFEIVVKGVGGHGAVPHATKDPVVLAAQIVLALQTITSREVDPIQSAVITVGAIHGGARPNVVPSEVTLQITVRTYTDKVREQVIKAIDRIAKGAAVMAGMPKECEPVIRKIDECPLTYNDPALVERIKGALGKVIGQENLVPREPSMGSEDFGMYGKTSKVPSVMMWLGSVNPEKVAASNKGSEKLPGLHSCYYKPEMEGTIRMGVMGLSVGALEILKKE